MGRAPCCEKMGLKRGPWSKEEDDVLVAYINQFGHENWRALPKRAGLLRCGKSCRLRWTNYLRRDIKRGNFTKEEEDTIIHLHHALGNRWSKIAAKLPGRTDNEIKNVWHTHLKKRLKKPDDRQENNNHRKHPTLSDGSVPRQLHCSPATVTTTRDQFRLNSPLQSSSSSDVTSITVDNAGFSPLLADDVLENYFKLDDGFWSFENSTGGDHFGYGFNSTSLNLDDDMKFWSELFHLTAEERPELPDYLTPSSPA